MLRALAILICGTFIGAALLTPALYSLLGWLLGETPWQFSRVFDRVAMLVALLLLLTLRRKLPLGEVRQAFRTMGRGWQCGVLLSLGMVCSLGGSLAALPFLVDGTKLSWEASGAPLDYLWKILRTLPAALLIASIEESFFRVLMIRSLSARFSTAVALAGSSVLYAAVHFIRPVKDFAYTEFSLIAGFEYLAAVGERLLDAQLLPPFVGLLILGLTLALIFVRTSSIYLCIGLHAGWIVAVKLTALMILVQPHSGAFQGLPRQYLFIAQPLAWVAVLLAGAVACSLFNFGNPKTTQDRPLRH